MPPINPKDKINSIKKKVVLIKKVHKVLESTSFYLLLF